MIRKAIEKDLEKVEKLLYQVHKIHADMRPDIFVEGKKKYNRNEILELFKNDMKPVYVYVDENDEVLGYCMCEYQITEGKEALHNRKVLFIDDLCVDENQRGKKIGEKLYEFVVEVAKSENCDSLTLNVWNVNEGAYRFYERLGMQPLKTLMEQKL